jgi:WD40 repeat protein
MPLHALTLSAALAAAAEAPPALTPVERATFKGHTAPIDRLAFSPDGKLLVAGGGNTRSTDLKLWDVASGKLLGAFEGHPESLFTYTLSPDGRLLASGGMHPDVKVWDVATRAVRVTLKNETFRTFHLAFSADGKTLAGVGNARCSVWDLAGGERLRSFKVANSQGGAFSGDARLLALLNHQEIELWDVAAGRERTLLGEHRGGVKRVAFTPDGKTLASASNWESTDRRRHGQVKLWDVETGRERSTVPARLGYPMELAVRPDAGAVALLEWPERDGDSVVRLLDATTGRDLWSERRPARTWIDLSFAADGTLRVLDAPDAKTLRLRELPPPNVGRR